MRDILLPGSTPRKQASTLKVGTCPHYWLIESADGPTSLAVCKYCGARKDFYNSIPQRRPANSQHAHQFHGEKLTTQYSGGRV